MAANFNDDTWRLVKSEIDRRIENQTLICTNPEKTYRDVLQAQAKIAALKDILNMPRVYEQLAATKGR